MWSVSCRWAWDGVGIRRALEVEGPTRFPEEGEAGFRVEITYRQRFIRLSNGCSATGVSRGEHLLRFFPVLCAFAREHAVGTKIAMDRE